MCTEDNMQMRKCAHLSAQFPAQINSQIHKPYKHLDHFKDLSFMTYARATATATQSEVEASMVSTVCMLTLLRITFVYGSLIIAQTFYSSHIISSTHFRLRLKNVLTHF